MGDPLLEREAIPGLLQAVADAARLYCAELDDLPVQRPGSDALVRGFAGGLPEEGDGGLATVTRLLTDGLEAATNSSGPRFFHFVIGGSTPAAVAADWVTSLIDNNAGLWVSSPFASRLEQLSLDWLKELLDLPSTLGGVITTGATMANFTALGAARQWWGEEQGVNIAERGMSGLPQLPIFSGGYVHASVRKALSMLGAGHGRIEVLSPDNATPIDLPALDVALRGLGGVPSIVLATAGEVNAGGFDPIEDMAEIAHRHNAWLHVDGAFGLFARASPVTSALARGVELADSAIVDGHKWLNVPYDCGFAFVKDARLLNTVFGLDAPYFPSREAAHPDFMYLSPEMSRRARALAVWATLSAYGRRGYQQMIERHLQLARRLGLQVREAGDFELLREPDLNVVCFRYRPSGIPEDELDELNRKLGQAIIEDGRVYFGTTQYGGRVAFRPAISNWRTTEREVDEILPVARRLGEPLLAAQLST